MKQTILIFFIISLLLLPSIQATTLNNGVMGYFGFNEGSGTNAIDGADRYNGTIVSASYSSNNVAGTHSLNAGTTSNNYYVDINPLALSQFLIYSTSEWTISMWVNSTTSNVWQRMYEYGGDSANNFFIQKPGTGQSIDNRFRHYALIGNQNAFDGNSGSGNIIPLNEWVMITSVGNGTHNILYMNGSQVGTPATITNRTFGAGFTRFYVGRRADATSENFAGLIDELIFYNRSLNSSEVSALYSEQLAGETYPFTIPVINNMQNLTLRLYNNHTLSYESEFTVFYNEFNSTVLFSSGVTVELDNSTLWNFTFIPNNMSLLTANYNNINISGLSQYIGYTTLIPSEPVNVSNVTFTAIDGSNLTIVGFSVSINGGEYLSSTSQTSLNISIPDTRISEELFNISFSKFGYYTTTIQNLNLSSLAYQGTLIAQSYLGDESLDDKSVIWIILAIVGGIGVSSIFSRPMLIVFGFSIMFLTYFLSGNIMISYYWFPPLGYVMGAVIILTGMLRLGFGENF